MFLIFVVNKILFKNFNLSIRASYPKINLPEAKIYSSWARREVLRYSLNAPFLCFQQHWLKTDFEKWRDEDDSDDEAGNDKDMQLEEVSF